MYSCQERNSGIISLLWPGIPVYEDELPFFLPEGKVVFYADRSPRGECEGVIRVRKELDSIAIDTRAGFLEAIRREYGPLESWEAKAFSDLDMDDFWIFAKARLVTQIPKRDFDHKPSGKVYLLLDALFNGFPSSYPVYCELGMPHQKVMLQLINMMTTASKPLTPDVNPWYRLLLERSRKNMTLFKTHVLSYVQSKQTEYDFLSFLYNLRPHTSIYSK